MPKLVENTERANVQIRTTADRKIAEALMAGGTALFAEGESTTPYRTYAKAKGVKLATRKHENGGTLVWFEQAEVADTEE